MRILALVSVSIVIGIMSARSADLQMGLIIIPSLPSDGVQHTNYWGNSFDHPVYVKKVKVLFYHPGIGKGSMTGSLTRSSDGAFLEYWSWIINDPIAAGNDCPTGNTAQDDFGDDWFVIQPGEEIILSSDSKGFGGLPGFAEAQIFYTHTIGHPLPDGQ